jgi:hypothetical protein
MKSLIFLTIIFVGLNSYSQINNDGLIFYSSFNSLKQDESTSNFLISNNGCSYSADRFGTNNSALNFNSSGFLTLNNNLPIISTSNFSLGGWAKMINNAGGIDSQSTLFEQRDDDATYSAKSTIVMFTKTSSNNAYFIVRSSINTNAASVSVTYPSQSMNTWHHYFGTKCDNTINFYIDGQLVGTSAYNQTGDFVTSVDHVSIGRHTHTSGQVYGTFDGDIDEFRIYNKCLTSNEVIDIYNNNFLAFEELEYQEFFNIYPNPTNDEFTISLSENSKAKKIEIIDLSGRIVAFKEIENETIEHNFRLTESAGSYIVRISDKDNSKIGQRKLMKY